MFVINSNTNLIHNNNKKNNNKSIQVYFNLSHIHTQWNGKKQSCSLFKVHLSLQPVKMKWQKLTKCIKISKLTNKITNITLHTYTFIYYTYEQRGKSPKYK